VSGSSGGTQKSDIGQAVTTAPITIRHLASIDEFRQVVALEQAIWGYTDLGDIVTVPVFIFTVKRGATLIGAFDPSTPPDPGPRPDPDSLRASDGRMVGFAYAVVGMKDGRPMMWSHMAGVLPEYRGGVGYQLKLEQRNRALAQGYELIEWTFDPMQAMNAHFNFAKLGGVVEEYAENFYGESTTAPRHADRSPGR
jgi:predicted GNAT superfamily acetyltransferase